MVRKRLSEKQIAIRISWDLARPAWGYLLLAFGANLTSAFFEGSTIGLFVAALHVLSGSSSELELGLLGHMVGGDLRQRLGREPIFLGLLLVAVLAQIFKSLLAFIGQCAAAHLQANVQAEAHHRIFGRIMRLKFSRVSSYRLGDLTHYLSQANQLRELFAQLNTLARNVFLVATYGVFLCWLSWQMSLVALAAFWIVSHFLQKIISQVEHHANRFTATMLAFNQRTTEFIQAVRLIYTFARQEDISRKVTQIAQAGIADSQSAAVWSSTIEPTMDILTVVGAAVFLTGGYLVLGPGGAATLPFLLAFLVALHRMTPRLGAIHSSLATLAALIPNIARVAEILQEQEDPEILRSDRPFPGFKEVVEFRQVTLCYRPDEPPAVKDLSFRIHRGHLTALVGMSGAGKSTAVDLLVRLFEPTSGEILVDGVPLSVYSLSSWRQQLGVVFQEPFLFHSSIRENIAFGKPSATMEEIVAAAKAAYADEFIRRLADGYETVVGDRGWRLSGGQRQRIALARALIRQPKLLILDEATSALDSESERFIQQTMAEQRGIRTILIIAHRLSTVSRADQIFVLDGGRLVEEGTHDSLVVSHGLYAHLWHLQSQDQRQRDHIILEGAPS